MVVMAVGLMGQLRLRLEGVRLIAFLNPGEIRSNQRNAEREEQRCNDRVDTRSQRGPAHRLDERVAMV